MKTTNPLKPCPNKPNCVSTTSEKRDQSMLPLHFRGTLQESKEKIKVLIAQLPRTKIETEEGPYLHFTFRSTFFGFVDDVEFYFDEVSKMIHFRSASRTGYSDLGVNRKRMEQIAQLYAKS